MTGAWGDDMVDLDRDDSVNDIKMTPQPPDDLTAAIEYLETVWELDARIRGGSIVGKYIKTLITAAQECQRLREITPQDRINTIVNTLQTQCHELAFEKISLQSQLGTEKSMHAAWEKRAYQAERVTVEDVVSELTSHLEEWDGISQISVLSEKQEIQLEAFVRLILSKQRPNGVIIEGGA